MDRCRAQCILSAGRTLSCRQRLSLASQRDWGNIAELLPDARLLYAWCREQGIPMAALIFQFCMRQLLIDCTLSGAKTRR